MISESAIQGEVLREHRKFSGIRLFRNNIGLFWSGKHIKTENGFTVLQNARQVKCGLKNGSSDLIGWKTVEITPNMVGQKIAVFASAELKTAKGRASKDQKNWIDAVNLSGGLAGIVRSMDGFRELFHV
jgi:hypothetical protein